MRAYGQKEPLIEYRRESYIMFKEMTANFERWREEQKEKIKQIPNDQLSISNEGPSVLNSKPVENWKLKIENSQSGKIGRNDPCPCGSGKKYKKCHGA